MFGTLAAAAALAVAPAQAGALNLTNVRTPYGELGAVRTDNRYLPGDFFFLAFDMDGLAVSPEGKVSYTMMVEVTDKAGKPVFKQDKPAENDEFIVLGGNRTLSNPTNLASGTHLMWRIKQDATGSRTLAYGTAFKFPGGVVPTLSSTANALDILTGVTDGTTVYCNLLKDLR